jgi:hypothetical protein
VCRISHGERNALGPPGTKRGGPDSWIAKADGRVVLTTLSVVRTPSGKKSIPFRERSGKPRRPLRENPLCETLFRAKGRP